MCITLGFTALGAVATIALREASDDQPVADPVRAAAVTGACVTGRDGTGAGQGQRGFVR